MQIAIEAQRIFRRDKHGMDFVILETIRELQKHPDANHYYVIVAPGEDRCLQNSENLTIIELRCPTYPLWEQVALPCLIKKLKVDLLHCTSNTAPLWCPAPLVLTLHDIIYLEPRQHRSASFYQELGWYYRKWIVPQIIKKCKQVITVSHFECERIRQTLHLPSKQITAIYNGYNPHFHPQAKVDMEILHRYIEDKDYLFFLGNTDPKKNTKRVLRAYSNYLLQSNSKRKLLVADLKEEYIDDILKEEGIEQIKPWLRFPGYIANDHLSTLYNAAFVFLHPSLRESFGIPMLEAMACGTPVIVGNTSAMPEVAGKGALTIDPFQEQEITNALLCLENDAQLYKEKQAYGLQRVSLFSWEQTAEAYTALYRNLLNNKQ